MSDVRSTYTKQPHEKINLGEAQALIATKVQERVAESLQPITWAAKWSLILSVSALILAIVSGVIAVI